MPLVSMRQLLDHAAENGYGLPAFNVNNLEQVRAIMDAADEVDAPVIMQGSAGARKYAGEPFLRHLIQAAIEAYPHIPVVMHQDHGQSPAVCMAAIRSGFSSVMMDGSLLEDGKTPSSYEYNVETSILRTRSASLSRPNSACWARSRPCAATRRTATGPRAP
jgi:fructose-bisphosphate aldolase class II